MSMFVGGVCRLTRDSELKYTNNGKAICHFSVATDDTVKEGDSYVKKPSFWDIELWDKQGESLAQYLVKGKQIFLTGTQKKDTWEKDGSKHEKVKITASNVELLGGGTDKRVQVDANNPTPSKSANFEDDLPPF